MPIDGNVFRNIGPNPVPMSAPEPENTLLVLSEGQLFLLRAAKRIYKQWSSIPIRHADINDKLAYDKLIWLVHNFVEPAFVPQESEGQFFPEGWVDVSNRSVEATF